MSGSGKFVSNLEKTLSIVASLISIGTVIGSFNIEGILQGLFGQQLENGIPVVFLQIYMALIWVFGVLGAALSMRVYYRSKMVKLQLEHLEDSRVLSNCAIEQIRTLKEEGEVAMELAIQAEKEKNQK